MIQDLTFRSTEVRPKTTSMCFESSNLQVYLAKITIAIATISGLKPLNRLYYSIALTQSYLATLFTFCNVLRPGYR